MEHGDSVHVAPGEFEADEPNGVGTCKYADGCVYEGLWAAGMRHGEGECRYSDWSADSGMR